MKKAIEIQIKQNQELIYRNAALQADIQDLKNGNDAVQERARLQLGMIKNDEVFVQVMDQPSAVQPVTAGQVSTQPEVQPNTENAARAQPAKPSNLKPVAPAPANSVPNTRWHVIDFARITLNSLRRFLCHAVLDTASSCK